MDITSQDPLYYILYIPTLHNFQRVVKLSTETEIRIKVNVRNIMDWNRASKALLYVSNFLFMLWVIIIWIRSIYENSSKFKIINCDFCIHVIFQLKV